MKKLIISAALGLMIPLMSIGQSTLGPGVTGSSLTVPGLPHNFSQATWNPEVLVNGVYKSGQQICQPCHTPHNADITVVEAPLWNHTLSNATYTMYSGIRAGAGTMGAVIDGTSKLCLSCHDGSIAVSSFGGSTASTPDVLTGGPSLGTDLSNDHPIGIVYADAITAGWGGLQPTTYLFSTYVSPGVYSQGTRAISTKLDANGKIQCTSCHGAHANSRGYQLGMDNHGSALCLACHKK